VRGNGCRDYRLAPEPIGHPAKPKRTGRVKPATCSRFVYPEVLVHHHHQQDDSYQGVDQYHRPIHPFLRLWPNRNCKENPP
jgi:hypothetical protein